MNTNFSSASGMHFRISSILIMLLIMSQRSQAEPYLAIKNNLQCSSCHVNPIGGGARNTYGNFYGHNQLPSSISDLSTAEIGKIGEFLNIGGDFRYNAEHNRDDAQNSTSTFRVDSAQLYITLTPKDTDLTFYIDQQIAPGSAVNREAWAMYKFSGNHYLKAGKMFVPFGLRLEDDTAFVRQVTGFNFDSSDNGLDLGLQFSQSNINIFVTNGTSSVSNNDNKFLFGLRGEHLFKQFRLGATALVNTADEDQQSIFNLYGGVHFAEFTVLGEVDWINTDNTDKDIQQFVSLLELNYQLQQGLNLKFSAEYLDPDTDIDENHQTRYSFIAEYTPLSNLQLRLGIRSSEGIPQQAHKSNERFFVQMHLYF